MSTATDTPASLRQRIAEEEEDETFMWTIVFPEEDRRLFTTAPWKGEYRWFRSPNVVCLEHYRGNRGIKSWRAK